MHSCNLSCLFILSHIGRNFFYTKKIMIPSIKNSHWSLVVVDLERKELKYYDSLQGQSGMEYMKRMR